MDDTREVILQLVERALAGEHTKFERLRFFHEYIGARIVCKSTKKVVEALDCSADELFKNYCWAVRYQKADVNQLLAYKQLRQAVSFYEEELDIIENILSDYEEYLFAGNFWKAVLFGEERDTWNIH